MELLIATANQKKTREFRQMLGADRFSWRDLSEFPSGQEVAETGATFRDNACIKASAYARRHDMWALADDSGLAVDALGGGPGVLSARWAQVHQRGQGDADNNATLLRQMESIPEARRTARFVCVLALADPRGRIILTVQDSVEGVLLREARGAAGFGYDPLFLLPELGKTTAELPADQKHELSHRGKALRRLQRLIDRAGLFA